MTNTSPHFLSSRLLKATALAVPILAFYVMNRPVAHLANELAEPTFEYGVLVTILDFIVFVGVGILAVYIAIRIWGRA